jgi:class 3 adenylate cyclase
MRTILVILIVFLLVPAEGYSQQKTRQQHLDSLLAEVPRMKEDSNAVKLLRNISSLYRPVNSHQSVAFARRSLELAKKIKFKRAYARCYLVLGDAYSEKTEYALALDYYFKALDEYRAANNEEGIADVYLQVGHVYWAQANTKKSEEYLEKARTMSIAQKDTGRWISVLVHLGSLSHNDARKSMDYYLLGLDLAERKGQVSTIMSLTSNVGNGYQLLGQYNKAMVYYAKALRTAEALGITDHVATINSNMGLMLVSIADSVSVPGDSLVPAGRETRLSKAIELLKKSLRISQEAGVYTIIPAITGGLATAYQMKGDYKEAYAWLEKFVVGKDSIFSNEKSDKIAELESKRALLLKDKDIQLANLALAKKRNETTLYIITSALLLIITFILFRNFRKQKKSNALLEKEKSCSDNLLLNILPAEVAEELKEKGDAKAKQYDEVSVLFTDFVDFTGTAEHMSPQDLVKELHDCFTVFDAIIERNGLEKIKTIGDAYMAVCGLPNKDTNNAYKAVQAALEIRDYIENRNKQKRGFNIRIGVNSGPVVAGIVGVKKFAYDIWGDAVNTAARMEQHGTPGEVNISRSTYDLVKDHFRCTSRGKLAVKNKGEVEMFFVREKL